MSVLTVTRVVADNPGPMTAEGTNGWYLRGSGGTVVIDPGPRVDHRLRAVDDLAAVLLTHRHDDHAGAVAAIAARVPVFAADRSLCRGADPLQDGEILRLAGSEVVVVATPGHTDDSVCFSAQTASGPVLFTGDVLSAGRQRAFVSRRTGDLSRMLDSLGVLARLDGVRGHPGHGDDIADVGRTARAALVHRLERLDRLADQVRADSEADVEASVRRRYGRDPARMAAALWMLRTDLEYLRRTDRVPEG